MSKPVVAQTRVPGANIQMTAPRHPDGRPIFSHPEFVDGALVTSDSVVAQFLLGNPWKDNPGSAGYNLTISDKECQALIDEAEGKKTAPPPPPPPPPPKPKPTAKQPVKTGPITTHG